MIANDGAEAAKAWAEGLLANLARAARGRRQRPDQGPRLGRLRHRGGQHLLLRPRPSANEVDGLSEGADNIGLVFPNQETTGTHVNIAAAGVAAHAPHPDAAISFLEYLATPEAQAYFADQNYEYPGRAGRRGRRGPGLVRHLQERHPEPQRARREPAPGPGDLQRDRLPLSRTRAWLPRRLKASLPPWLSRKPSRRVLGRPSARGDDHARRWQVPLPTSSASQPVLVLVAANGFFVAAEFSLVAVRRSRVAELVAARTARMHRRCNGPTDHLDANLAATQLGITISSLALGWIGEPALAHLIEPLLERPAGAARDGRLARHRGGGRLRHHHRAAHRPRRTCAEEPRAPAQRAHGVVDRAPAQPVPLPAPSGDRHASTVSAISSSAPSGFRPALPKNRCTRPEELKLLVRASQDAGILQDAQEEVMVRVFNIGERRIGDIMTPRPRRRLD